ncbi:exodeoxyribonuclease 7 small subunit [Arthrobacter sp. Hiyo8]|nr:exodeoxyribonuclease 7 small subunit [Arthrobacter sp. Hiyo8]
MAIVGRLEAGGASLEESLALWERGEALAKRCEEWLEGARRRLAAARNNGEDEATAS